MTPFARVVRPVPLRMAIAALGVLLCLGLAGTPRNVALANEDDALASAVYGNATLWLQRKPDDRKQAELVFRETSSSEPRVIPVTLPKLAQPLSFGQNVALGLDARGVLTAVVEGARGLYQTRVTGTPRLRQVPGTTRGDGEPGLFRGKLSYARYAGEETTIVRLVSLASGRGRTVWSIRAPATGPLETAVGAGRAVVIVTHTEGAAEGTYRAVLARPGRRPQRLLVNALGHHHQGGIWVAAVAPSGRRAILHRLFDEEDADIAFALPSGRRLSR